MIKSRNTNWIYAFIVLDAAYFTAALGIALPDAGASRIIGCFAVGAVAGLAFAAVFKWSGALMEMGILSTVMFIIPPAAFAISLTSPYGMTMGVALISIIAYCALFAAVVIKENRGMRSDSLAALIIGLLAIMYVLIVCVLSAEVFSPDSYSYYEISKNIFTDFGKVNTIRQYVIWTGYDVSFPYLYPAAIGAVNALCGFGVYAGEFINAVICVCTMAVACKLSHRLCGSFLPGAVAFAMLVFNRNYVNELTAARAVPAAVLCVLLLIYLLLDAGKLSYKRLAAAGLIAGAGMVIRFDFMFAAAFAGLMVLIFQRGKRIRSALAYGGALLAPASPWIIYSVARFGSLWVSDNMGTMLYTKTVLPNRFYLPDEEVSTIFTDFGAWFDALMQKAGNVISSFAECSSYSFGIVVLVVLTAAVIYYLHSRAGGQKISSGSHRFLTVFICVAIFYVLKLMSFILVGYTDTRYHTETVAVLALFALCAVYRIMKNVKLKSVKLTNVIAAGMACLLALSVIIPTVAPDASGGILSGVLNRSMLADMNRGDSKERPYGFDEMSSSEKLFNMPVLDERYIVGADWISGLSEAVKESSDGSEPRIFFMGGSNFEYGAFSGDNVFIELRDSTPERLKYLTQEYIKPTHIYCSDNYLQSLNVLSEIYEIEKVDGAYPLYTVSEK